MASSSLTERTAQDVMHSRYVTTDGFMTVTDGIELMRQYDATAIIVDRRDEKDELGLVLASDIAKKSARSQSLCRPCKPLRNHEQTDH